MRGHMRHQKNSPWKNIGANGIVAGNNPIRIIDPDGREGEDITIYNALKNGGNPLAVLGGHASKTMVDAVNNAPSIIEDMATANPEANAQFAMLMAAPVAGSLVGAGTALAADALLTSIVPMTLQTVDDAVVWGLANQEIVEAIGIFAVDVLSPDPQGSFVGTLWNFTQALRQDYVDQTSAEQQN